MAEVQPIPPPPMEVQGGLRAHAEQAVKREHGSPGPSRCRILHGCRGVLCMLLVLRHLRRCKERMHDAYGAEMEGTSRAGCSACPMHAACSGIVGAHADAVRVRLMNGCCECTCSIPVLNGGLTPCGCIACLRARRTLSIVQAAELMRCCERGGGERWGRLCYAEMRESTPDLSIELSMSAASRNTLLRSEPCSPSFASPFTPEKAPDHLWQPDA
jgi:hypothetical protein